MPTKKSKNKPKDQSFVPTPVVINPPIPKAGPNSEDNPLTETVQRMLSRRARNGA